MPKLSIIVPTRERSDTLVHTMRTLVSQDYPDCEILVSDNASLDNTKEVVASFTDARIRYINTGKRVSMSENWEFALQYAQGEFITYIGDDDGFLPRAISKAMALLEDTGMSALAWDRVNYNWPSFTTEGAGNWIWVRVGKSHTYLAESRKRLAKLLQFRDGFAYSRLPGVYHGIVRKSLTDKVKESSSRKIFFDSISPDIFSALVIGMVLDRYLLSEYPFTIAGASRHSTGLSTGKGELGDPNSSAGRFLSELSREFDSRVKIAPAIESLVMGEYLLAKQALPNFDFPEPSWNRYVRRLIRRAKNSDASDEILRSASHTVKLLGLKVKVPDQVVSNGLPLPTPGMQGDILVFKAPESMVSNVFDACIVVAGMIPSPTAGNVTVSLRRFVRNMSGCFISEAKSLYRSV